MRSDAAADPLSAGQPALSEEPGSVSVPLVNDLGDLVLGLDRFEVRFCWLSRLPVLRWLATGWSGYLSGCGEGTVHYRDILGLRLERTGLERFGRTKFNHSRIVVRYRSPEGEARVKLPLRNLEPLGWRPWRKDPFLPCKAVLALLRERAPKAVDDG